MESTRNVLAVFIFAVFVLAKTGRGLPVPDQVTDRDLIISEKVNSTGQSSQSLGAVDNGGVTTSSNSTVYGSSTIKPKITEGNLLKSIFSMGFGSLTDYAQQAKLIQDLKKNRTNIEEYFKNRTELAHNHTINRTSDVRERHHHHYNHGYGGYYGGYGNRPSYSSILLGGMIGHGLGRRGDNKPYEGGYGGYGGYGVGGGYGGNYRTAMMMSSLARVGRKVSNVNGYRQMKSNFAPVYYRNSRGYGPPPVYDPWSQPHGPPPAYNSLTHGGSLVGQQPPPYGWNVNQGHGQPPPYSATNPHIGRNKSPPGWIFSRRSSGAGPAPKSAVVSKPSSGGGFSWPMRWSPSNAITRGGSGGLGSGWGSGNSVGRVGVARGGGRGRG